VSEGGLELRRQRCRTVVKNPNRLVSSGPGTPPLPIHDGKSGQIRGVRWNGGGTGTWELAKTLSANSTRQTNAVLRAALAQAVKWGWTVANPTAGATPSSKFKPKREAIAMASAAMP
jgi:hypothetical protein